MNVNIYNGDRFSTMNNAINNLVKSWHVLKQTDKTWNLKSVQQYSDKIRPLLTDMQKYWDATEADLAGLSQSIRQELNSSLFVTELEKELQAAGIQFSGEFPLYVLPPFKLTISLDSYEARLSLGRKSERTADLNPQRLAKWVSVRYKKVLSRKFNSAAFMKDLLEAYRMANQLIYHEKDLVWGRAVPIMDLYDILTIKASSRQDYPRQFFIFDLGLLKESPSLILDRYRFEYGFARNQSRAILVVDSSGRESHISSLTIYSDEGGT